MPFDTALGVGAKANRLAEEHGLIRRALGDAVGFCPPLIVDEEMIGEMVSRSRVVLDMTYCWLQDNRRSDRCYLGEAINMSVIAPVRLTAELRQIPKESVKDRVYAG